MPFVRISLLEGKSTEYRQAIGDSIHQALVQNFGIPELDRFQVIHEIARDNLIFPPHYMDIPHTENIVYIDITCKEGRTVAMKQALFKAIAELIHQRTGLTQDDVFITLTENKGENWSFGQGIAQLVP